MFKQFVRSPRVLGSFGALVWAYMSLLDRTMRWRVEGAEHARALFAAPGPFVVAAWHSRILLMPFIKFRICNRLPRRPRRGVLMVSASRDGEITSRTARLLGMQVIRASAARKDSTKDKRGFQGAREAISAMKEGAWVVMTMDGPRGPAEVAGLGAVKLAQQLEAPILIYGLSAHARRLNTWDRLLAPGLFARAAVVFEEPILTTRRMDSEALREEVERRLKAATQRADRLAGLEPDPGRKPAPPPEPVEGAAEPSS